MATRKPYIVRELPFLKGTKRRVIERCQHLHEACALARQLSAQQRLIEIELQHVVVDQWLNGERVKIQRPPGQEQTETAPPRKLIRP